jgi:SET domain-containing protein 6
MPTDIKKSPTGCTCENPDPASFQSWCKKHSVLWQTCTMGMSAATGRCVLAARDIAPGEVVVQVPDDMVLMAENCSIQAQLEGEQGRDGVCCGSFVACWQAMPHGL